MGKKLHYSEAQAAEAVRLILDCAHYLGNATPIHAGSYLANEVTGLADAIGAQKKPPADKQMAPAPIGIVATLQEYRDKLGALEGDDPQGVRDVSFDLVNLLAAQFADLERRGIVA